MGSLLVVLELSVQVPMSDRPPRLTNLSRRPNTSLTTKGQTRTSIWILTLLNCPRLTSGALVQLAADMRSARVLAILPSRRATNLTFVN